MKSQNQLDLEGSFFGRETGLFSRDLDLLDDEICARLADANCLVVGAAGTIGQAVTMEIFKRNPKKLHVVDISENNMVELVRSIRSSFGYSQTDFRTFAIDVGSLEFKALFEHHGPYHYIFNLSALKHVRSEKDPYTLMRMVEVNIFNPLKMLDLAGETLRNYFCVSTDKAANPSNMMGASKRIMELFTTHRSSHNHISMARFANVAFSDGSLLHGFTQRFLKRQPISAPNDIRRYFVTRQEAGQLCLIAGVLGENRDILFPKLVPEKHLIKFDDIAIKYCEQQGFEPYLCETEEQARKECNLLISSGKWPCYFFNSDTSGEKPFEEFYTASEDIDITRFETMGAIKLPTYMETEKLLTFVENINNLKNGGYWSKTELLQQFKILLPSFDHVEKGKSLDERM